jgi:hypothetical protein
MYYTFGVEWKQWITFYHKDIEKNIDQVKQRFSENYIFGANFIYILSKNLKIPLTKRGSVKKFVKIRRRVSIRRPIDRYVDTTFCYV